MHTIQTPLSRIGFAAFIGLVSPLAAPAAGPPPDKSGFHLFHPTPRPLMRELSTDRPDLTESAFTVDAGHFQVEADLVRFGYDHDTAAGADATVESWTAGAFNLKAGLLNSLDLQIGFDSYQQVTTDDETTGTRTRQAGFGDVVTRLKLNLWGNDGGKTALAVMPFVKFPTNQDGLGNDHVEGGIILPFALELPGGWGLGAMTEFDFVRNADDTGHRTDFVNSIALGRELYGPLAAYVEFFSAVAAESSVPWVGIVGLGFTWELSPDFRLDGGLNFGVTDAAEDLSPFLGFSWRY